MKITSKNRFNKIMNYYAIRSIKEAIKPGKALKLLLRGDNKESKQSIKILNTNYVRRNLYMYRLEVVTQ